MYRILRIADIYRVKDNSIIIVGSDQGLSQLTDHQIIGMIGSKVMIGRYQYNVGSITTGRSPSRGKHIFIELINAPNNANLYRGEDLYKVR